MPNYSTSIDTTSSSSFDDSFEIEQVVQPRFDELYTRIADLPVSDRAVLESTLNSLPHPTSGTYLEFGEHFTRLYGNRQISIPFQNLNWYSALVRQEQQQRLVSQSMARFRVSESIRDEWNEYAGQYAAAIDARETLTNDAMRELADKLQASFSEPEPTKKKHRKFSKKQPLKLKFKKSEKRGSVKKETKRLINYKDFLKSDPEMSSSLKHNIQRDIQKIRYRRKNNMQHDKLVLSYRGVEQEVPMNSAGFVDKKSYKRAKQKLITQLRKRRYSRQRKNQVHKSIENVPYDLVGGVHQRKGSILDLMQRLGYNRVNSLRKPKTDENHVGIEVEFYTQHHREDITQRLISAKLTNNCRIMTDTSIRPKRNRNGYELCILAPENELEEIIYRACDVLNDIDAEVNESCGLHVHLDCRNRDKSLLYHNLYSFQDLLFALVSPTRLDSRYCTKQTTPSFSDSDSSHYAAISTASYRKHRTIEIRMHHGTTVAKEIINWVKLLTKIANYDKKISSAVNNPNELNNVVNLDSNTYEYFNSRYRLFGS